MDESEALDRVAENNVEEEAGSGEVVDTAALSVALKDLGVAEAEQAADELKRKMELDAVNVLKEDVETVMAEFDLDKAEADALLRESQGNLKKTLLSLVRGGLKAK
jgi:hypothetical protein